MKFLVLVFWFFASAAFAQPNCPAPALTKFLSEHQGVNVLHNCELEVRLTAGVSQEDPSKNSQLVALSVEDLALAKFGSATTTLVEFAIPSICFENSKKMKSGLAVYRENVDVGEVTRVHAMGILLDSEMKTNRFEVTVYQKRPYKILARSVCAADLFNDKGDL